MATSFLNRINKTVEILWNDYSRKYPGFFYKDQDGRKSMPKIIAAQTMMNLPDFPHYARQYVDQDPTSWYFMMNAQPLAGPADRDTAVRLFYDIFINQLGMHSSYEQEGYDTETAVDKEVLPAAVDKNYKTFYDQQMEQLEKMLRGGAEDAGDEDDAEKAANDEFEKKYGFRPDDPDIIDVDVDDGQPAQKPGLQKADRFTVGAPRKIWYAVDFHIPANNELGYNGAGGGSVGGSSRRGIGGPGGGVRRLREEELDAMVQEATAEDELDAMVQEATATSVAAKLDELISMVEPGSGLQIALLDIKDKFALSECDACGDPACKDGEICGLKEAVLSQDDRDDIADMFAGYSGGGSSLGVSRAALDGFMNAHAAELQQLRKSQASGLGDFGAARDLGNDDEQYESEEDIEKEIAGIVNEGDEPDEPDEDDEPESSTFDEEYWKDQEDYANPEYDESDDVLGESFIRHSTMLAKEIW